METYIKTMQIYYNEKLDELRETLGILPAEMPGELARIIINPHGQLETEFCVKSIGFLNETTSFFDDIESEMIQADQPTSIIKDWKDNLRWFTSYHGFHYNERTKLLNRLLELRPQLVSELTSWAKDCLTKHLTTPETETELDLCRGYTSYLDGKVSFLEDKKRYLERIESIKRQKTIAELEENPKKQGILVILKDPQTSEELMFCKSFFALQDDLDFLKEAAEEGRVVPINIEASEALKSLSMHINFGKVCSFLRWESELGHAYFQLKAIENTNYEGMVTLIAGRGIGFVSAEAAYSKAISAIEDYMIAGIERGYPRMNDCIRRFILVQEAFNCAYRQGVTYEALTSINSQTLGEQGGPILARKLLSPEE